MRFTNILAIAATLLLSTTSALPAPQPTDKPTGVKPPHPKITMPSVQELLLAFKPEMPKDSALFYTGGTKMAAMLLQAAHLKSDPGNPLLTIKEVWAGNKAKYNSDYWQIIDGMDKEAAEKEYGRRSSEAFALATTGKATVVIPDPFNQELALSSVWMSVELPVLKVSMKDEIVTQLTTKRYKKVGKNWVFVNEDVGTFL